MQRFILVFAFLTITATSFAQEARQSQTVTVRAGQMQRIAFYPAAKKDCTRSPLPEVRLIDKPRNGRIIVQRSNIVAAHDSACPGQTIPGLLVFFVANAGFAGEDSASYSVSLQERQGKVYLKIRVIGGRKKPTDGMDI